MNKDTAIYFVECQGFIKIAYCRGDSAILPEHTTSALYWGNPFNMVFLGYILFDTEKEARKEKNILRERFENLWHRNDWYRKDSELSEYIQEHAELCLERMV